MPKLHQLPAFFLFCILFLPILTTAQTATEYYNNGLKAIDDKKYDVALVQLRNAVEKDPGLTDAWFELGWTYNELTRYPEAVTALDKAALKWDDVAKVYFEKGYALENQKLYADARDAFEKCVSLDKDYSGAWKHLGDLFFSHLNKYNDAIDAYNNYISTSKKDITDETIYYNKGWCENELERYTEAKESFTNALKIKPDNALAYAELGYSNYNLKNDDEAIASYNQAIKYDPKNITPYLGIGDVYKDNKKDGVRAMEYYKTGLGIDPTNKKANYSLGWCYNDKNLFSQAIPYLKKALEKDSNYGNAITELGYSYYSTDQFADAINMFKRAIVIDPKSVLSRYYSGLCYLKLGQKSNAEKMVQELTAINSTYAETLRKKIDAQ